MLGKTAEYALRAAVWLGREPGQAESADSLAERTKVPRRYLHKVLQDLVRAKLVIGKHARALCQAAIQSHGGIGMTEEYAVGHCLRRVHALDHLFGDVWVQAGLLARPKAVSA